MVNDKSNELDGQKELSSQADGLQGQLGNMLSGVERSLAVTCESIMGKMQQLEQKIQDMEKRYTELAKDAESVLKEAAEETTDNGQETKSADGTADSKK